MHFLSLAGVTVTVKKTAFPSTRFSHPSPLMKSLLPQLDHYFSPASLGRNSSSLCLRQICLFYMQSSPRVYFKIPPHMNEHALLLNYICSLPKVSQIHPFSSPPKSALLPRRSHISGGSKQVLHCCL